MHQPAHVLTAISCALLMACSAGSAPAGLGADTNPDDTADTAAAAATDSGSAADSGTAKDTGGVDTTPPTPGGTEEAFRTLCVATINDYRKTLALPALARWDAAETCSDGEAKSDSESGKAHGAFGKCGEGAQNECPGWSGPSETMITGCLKMMWDEGPGADFSKHGHYINMSSTKYTKVSCGIFKTPAGSYWSVQNFQ